MPRTAERTRNKIIPGQVSMDFGKGGLNIPTISGSSAVYDYKGRLIVPDIPSSRKIDLGTGEVLPEHLEILETLKGKRVFPSPVNNDWLAIKTDKKNWKGFNKENEYELSEGNFLVLKRNLEELKRKFELENRHLLSSIVGELLTLPNDELLSKFVVIKTATKLYEVPADGYSVPLIGHIIALPIREQDGDWATWSQKFVYVANASDDKEVYKIRCGHYWLSSEKRNLSLGTMFELSKGTTYLLNTEFLRPN